MERIEHMREGARPFDRCAEVASGTLLTAVGDKDSPF